MATARGGASLPPRPCFGKVQVREERRARAMNASRTGRERTRGSEPAVRRKTRETVTRGLGTLEGNKSPREVRPFVVCIRRLVVRTRARKKALKVSLT